VSEAIPDPDEYRPEDEEITGAMTDPLAHPHRTLREKTAQRCVNRQRKNNPLGPSSQSGILPKWKKRTLSRTAAVGTLWRALAIPPGEVCELAAT
jgi:hypothetical protein